jgi:hypothetical protein
VTDPQAAEPEARPLNHYDVTGRIHVSSPVAVRDAVLEILHARFQSLDPTPLHEAFLTFTRLYAGDLPGFVGCDTWYHDAQHSLDAALAMARLIDGFQRNAAVGDGLTPRRATLGILIALFHDAGYVRRTSEPAKNGAEYTLNHVRRSGEFLREYLPKVGYEAEAGLASQLVHFTGYEIELDRIRVVDRRDRVLGFLLGTADSISQFADRCYLEKCRDFLSREFAICGLLGPGLPGGPTPIYSSTEDLMDKTHAFHEKVRRERLDGYFESVHRYMAVHFGGEDPYTQMIAQHLEHLEELQKTGRMRDVMRRKPEVIGAAAMRAALADPRISAPPRATGVAA